VTAELTARITAARATTADFRRATAMPGATGYGAADWQVWTLRLDHALTAVLHMLDTPATLITRAAARDRAAADPGARKLAAIRAVLDSFDWESGDLQYALEAIDRLLNEPGNEPDPEPGPEFDPGPQCDDQGGMSEYQPGGAGDSW